MRVEDRGLLALGRGVAVVSRVPGFCAYRMLQNGDVLLSMTVGEVTVEFNRTDDLMDSVRAVQAGQTITFEVLRQGEILRVPITLDPRPAHLDNLGATDWLREFNNRRADEVETYWSRDFAPLLGEQLG
jgi:S1-C subfamily serine protease